LPRYAQPRRIVVCREFPLLSSGKVDRRALQRQIAETGE
jgi:acyl-coenzyme A synthetase/AMP-(fatty) acid ligase